MKLKYTFEITELDNQIIAVPVGDNAMNFRGVVVLNEYGAAIMERLKEETTINKVVESLLEEYEGTKEKLTDFVEQFVEKLKDEELIEG